MIGRGEQIKLDMVAEEGGDVVPVIFDSGDEHFFILVPILFELVSKDVECLVVCILFNSGPSFKTVDDELETDLSILIANR